MHRTITAAALVAIVGACGSALPARAQQPAQPPPAQPTQQQQQPQQQQPQQQQPQQQQTSPGAQQQPLPSDQALPPPPIPAVLPAVPDVAPGYSAPNLTAPAGELVGVTQSPFVGVRLEDAVTMALQRNTDLAIAQSNQRIANYQIVAAQGAYDIRFQLQPSYQHSVSAPVSSFQAGPNGGPITQDTVGVTTGFTARTGNGGSASLTTSAQKITTNSTIESFSPQYFTAVTLQFTQPLLRGLATDDTRRQILLARANSALQQNLALTNASQTIANVADAYWDLVAAWRNVSIQEEGLRNAQAQAASNARLAARGAAAPVDVVESNTQINVFQDNVLSALLNVQRLQNQLKSLILANPADPTWQANLVPTSSVGVVPAEPTVDNLIVSALVHRPEVAQLRAQRQTADANLAFARDQLKPQLDVTASATANGFAGSPTDPTSNPIFAAFGPQVAAINALIARANAMAAPGTMPIPPVTFAIPGGPAYLNGGLGQSYSNLVNGRFPTFNISLTLGIPLRNRTAKADFAIAQEQSKQVEVNELALLQRVRTEATNAIQSLRETEYRLVAARDARLAAQRVLLAEQRRFNAGTSTTFLVLQRQLDVANQEGRELQAQTDLNKAVVELQRVGGTIFSDQNFSPANVGGQTLNAVSPTTSVLPSPAPSPPASQASPPPPRR